MHRIGYDGWVKDILVVLQNDGPAGNEALLAKLHEYLFHTTYKTDYLYLDEGVYQREGIALDVSISAVELKQWFETEERFYPVGGGDTLAINDILNQRKPGVFFSEQPGFVIWAMPVRADISGSKEAIRQFTIDSDLILGAVSNGRSIAVIGRERATSISHLPPLRTETIQVIAAADKRELAQSYERNRAFAGHLQDGKDWAPIYLSPELINTEFGSLLNITDQLLKSWSSNGDVVYYDFPYPPPPEWCFGRPLMEILKANTLTFNWNTRGAFYTKDFGNLEYLLLNRTGALPMTYIPNENDLFSQNARDVAPYEEQGYDCYAKWQDPNLIRVVQYTSLFEIFRNFEITAESPVQATSFKSTVIENEVEQLLEDIAGLDKKDIGELAYQFLDKRTNCQGPKDWCEKEIKKESEAYVPEFQSHAAKIKEYLSLVKENYGERGYEVLIGVLANPEYADKLELTSQVEADRVNAVVRIANSISGEFGFFLDAMVEKDAVRDKYVKGFEGIEGKWIKTPSIVLSWNKSNAKQEAQTPGRGGNREIRILVGGHNLTHHVPEFRVSPAVSPGQVRVDREGYTNVVYINEKDIGKIHALTKIAATNPSQLSDLAQFAKLANEALPYAEDRPPRNRNEVIPAHYYQGARGHRPKKKKHELLALLGYDDVARFQRANRLTETGTLDNATLSAIDKMAQPLYEELERIGIEGSSVEEKIQRYLGHLNHFYGLEKKQLDAEAFQFMEREKELLSILNQQESGNPQPITLNHLHARIVAGHNRQFALINHVRNPQIQEIWEFDRRQILKRTKGTEALKILEDDMVKMVRHGSRQRENVKFSWFSYYSGKDARITWHIGDQSHSFAKNELESALNGHNPQLLEEVKQIILQSYGNDKQTILFVVDGLSQYQQLSHAVEKTQPSGKSEIIEEAIPVLEDGLLEGVRMVNPHKIASLLSDAINREAVAGGTLPPVRIGLSSSDLPKAWENASSMKVVSSAREVTLASNKKVIDANLLRTLNSYAEEAGMNLYDGKAVTESEGIIVISGLKGQQLRSYVEELGREQGALKNKYVILLSCFEMRDEVKYNSTVIQQLDAKGILFFDERIYNPAVDRVMKEFSTQVKDNKNLDLYDLFQSSVKKALEEAEAKKADPRIIEYLRVLNKGIIQFSYENEHLRVRVSNMG
ncbi:MAG: hypothetical protein J5I98_33175 [Phaeodactylibacter sp.]|nr:hypothetical protein [Phaeodactylibacter sp.]